MKLGPTLLACSDQLAHRAVRLSESRALAYEVIRKISCHHRRGQRCAHAITAERALRQRPSHGGKNEQQRVDGVEDDALVVLKVRVVALRDSLERRKKRR